MPTLWNGHRRACDRVTRRNFLRIGALGVGGLGLAGVLKGRAQGSPQRSSKSAIIICLPGGPSQLDSYDMKPKAPAEIRGEFQPIATNVPGIEICEMMSRQARIMDKFAIVRDLQFHNELATEHDTHEVFTGFPPKARRPPFGSIVSRLRPSNTGSLPPYISLARQVPTIPMRGLPEDPQYLGAAHRPFEPTGGELANLPLSVSLDRLDNRASLLRRLDTLRCDVDTRGEMLGMDQFTRSALEMIRSPSVLAALDISQEPASVQERYGRDHKYHPSFGGPSTWFSSKFLMARRLVEAGVPVVTIAVGSWDHHGVLSNGPQAGIFPRLREELPWFDQAFTALITDLDERGLLDEVVVAAFGEMGRTPRINHQAGRDHWQESGFALLAGGGLRTGQAIGATDSHAARPVTTPHSAQNVLATLYHALGIDPRSTLRDFTGRPQFLLDEQSPITELV